MPSSWIAAALLSASALWQGQGIDSDVGILTFRCVTLHPRCS